MNEKKRRNAELEALQQRIGYQFKDSALLELALTHSSYAHDQGLTQAHNERLEFLGDAVLELCVSSDLYQAFSEASEGQMTVMRANLVNGHTLAEISDSIGLTELVRKSVGEEWQGSKQKETLAADALEALIGAIYLECGFVSVKAVVKDLLLSRWPRNLESPATGDSKSKLQEWTMRHSRSLPSYSTISESGPEHAKIFMVMVKLPTGEEFLGTGQNRRKAEQAAAAKALDNLKSGEE